MKAIIFGNDKREEVAYYSARLFASLLTRGIDVCCEPQFAEFLKKRNISTKHIETAVCDDSLDADIAFSVGGDGTFIRSAVKVARRGIPILGINAGRLGFLADVKGDEEIDKTAEAVATGNYTIEDRPLLKLHTDEKKYSDFNYAINEIAILKQDSSAMIALNTKINGEFAAKYQADGLIIATATGSTAYAMSVGGPIIIPQAPTFIITPVAPHSLSMRPLVVTDDVEIDISVESRNGQFLISLDGRSNVFKQDTPLKIRKSGFALRTVRLPNHSFFSTLREKLMWGSDTRRY